MIRGDSTEYELLKEWCHDTVFLDPPHPTRIMTCEIGVREGLGSRIIIEAFRDKVQASGIQFLHIAIDPYDNLKYQHYDNSPPYTADYTDEMRLQLVEDFKDYPEFKFHHMTDSQFMSDHFWTEPYHFVHFDGPHMTKDVLTQAIWFANRSTPGTRFVFDDFPKYNMQLIRDSLASFDFKIHAEGENKICLERQI